MINNNGDNLPPGCKQLIRSSWSSDVGCDVGCNWSEHFLNYLVPRKFLQSVVTSEG